MIVYITRGVRRLLRVDFIRFCMVGGTGFLINISLLALLTGALELPVFWAQLVSSEIALFSNFLLHHTWTYKHHKVEKSVPTLLVQFHATTWPAIIGSTLMVSGGVYFLHLNKYVALVISSVIALLWNFAWSKFVVWRDISNKEVEELAG